MSVTARLICAPLVFLAFLVGCGGEQKGSVAGKVVYKGAPVTSGSISLTMKGKGVAQDAKLDASGAFTMTEPLPVGTYHVLYVPPIPEPQDPSKPRKVTAAPVAVPAKFQDLNTSNTTVEVTTGKNDLPIEFKN